MTLPLQTRTYLAPLYSQALSAIYTYYDQVRDPSYGLSQDIDFDEVMLREPKIYQGFQERTLSVSGPNWRVQPFNNSRDPKDKQLAKLMDDAFRQIPHFPESRKRLAGATFRGRAYELMTGKRKMIKLGGEEFAPENWWLFGKMKDVDPRRFTIRSIHETAPDGSKRIRAEEWMSTIPMYNGAAPVAQYETGPDMPSSLMAYGYRPVKHPEWFVKVIYDDDESRLSYGRPIRDVLYFYHWIKQILIREGLQGVERWAQGMLVVKIDAEAVGATDTQTSANTITQALNAINATRSRHIVGVDKRDEIQMVNGGGEGHQQVMSFISYIDDCMMAVCTGAVLMSSKGAVGEAGSYSRDKEGTKTQNKIILADQMKIDEAETECMMPLWIRQNWALIKKYGLEHARQPQIKTVTPKEVNPNEAATRYSTIWQANPRIAFREDDFYEDLGATPPEEGERTVVGADPGGEQSGMATDPAEMMMEGQAPPQSAASMRAKQLLAESREAQKLRRAR
jgi:hypothetical protein